MYTIKIKIGRPINRQNKKPNTASCAFLKNEFTIRKVNKTNTHIMYFNKNLSQ